jgi:hypothetical protein
MHSNYLFSKCRCKNSNVGNLCCTAITGLSSLLCLIGGATQISVHYLTKAFLASLHVSTSSNSLSNSESIGNSSHSLFSAQSPDIPRYFRFSSSDVGLAVGSIAVSIGLLTMIGLLIKQYGCKHSSEENYRRVDKEQGVDFTEVTRYRQRIS